MCLLKVCSYPVDKGRFKVKSGLFTLNMGASWGWQDGGREASEKVEANIRKVVKV